MRMVLAGGQREADVRLRAVHTGVRHGAAARGLARGGVEGALWAAGGDRGRCVAEENEGEGEDEEGVRPDASMLLGPACGRSAPSLEFRAFVPSCLLAVRMLYLSVSLSLVSGHRCMSDLHVNVVASCSIHQSNVHVAQREFVEEYEL